ncbi:MAG TPA: hypothetical protein VHO70_05430 [Chitinispirillaceae bacterium]|nr:hypothetical protein [Chitinispirillaceae bacterium]
MPHRSELKSGPERYSGPLKLIIYLSFAFAAAAVGAAAVAAASVEVVD